MLKFSGYLRIAQKCSDSNFQPNPITQKKLDFFSVARYGPIRDIPLKNTPPNKYLPLLGGVFLYGGFSVQEKHPQKIFAASRRKGAKINGLSCF